MTFRTVLKISALMLLVSVVTGCYGGYAATQVRHSGTGYYYHDHGRQYRPDYGRQQYYDRRPYYHVPVRQYPAQYPGKVHKDSQDRHRDHYQNRGDRGDRGDHHGGEGRRWRGVNNDQGIQRGGEHRGKEPGRDSRPQRGQEQKAQDKALRRAHDMNRTYRRPSGGRF